MLAAGARAGLAGFDRLGAFVVLHLRIPGLDGPQELSIVDPIGPVWDLIGITVTPRSASSYTVAITSRMSRPRRETFQTSKRLNFLAAASRFICSKSGRRASPSFVSREAGHC